MTFLQRLYRRRRGFDIDAVMDAAVKGAVNAPRYPMTGPGRVLEVTRGPSLEDWRRRIQTDNSSRSIVHIQAFGDGNKRVSHFAYSIVLIKNTRSFKAPTVELENWLYRMDR